VPVKREWCSPSKDRLSCLLHKAFYLVTFWICGRCHICKKRTRCLGVSLCEVHLDLRDVADSIAGEQKVDSLLSHRHFRNYNKGVLIIYSTKLTKTMLNLIFTNIIRYNQSSEKNVINQAGVTGVLTVHRLVFPQWRWHVRVHSDCSKSV